MKSINETENDLQQRTLLLKYMQERHISHSTKDEIFRLFTNSNNKELKASMILTIVKDNTDETEILRQAKAISD